MFRVRNAIADILDNQTLAEVVHNQQQANQLINNKFEGVRNEELSRK